MDMFNGRTAQQESGVTLLKNRVFTMGAGAKCTVCAFVVKAKKAGYQTWICG